MKKQVRFVNMTNDKKTSELDYLFIQSGIVPVLYGISEYCGMKFIDFPSSL